MINKDKLFQLFVDGKEVSGDKTNEEIQEFMNGPYAKIGMFVKLIQNHEILYKKFKIKFNQKSLKKNVK